MKLVYLHGLKDTPDNPLVNALKEQHQVITPDISSDPKVAYADLTHLFISLKGEDLVLIGSDMGGYWANYFANKHCLPSIIIDPIIEPSKTVDINLDSVNFTVIRNYKIIILYKDNACVDYRQAKKLLDDIAMVEILDNAEHSSSNIEFIKRKTRFLVELIPSNRAQLIFLNDEFRKSQHGMLAVLASRPIVNKLNLALNLLLDEILLNQTPVLVCGLEKPSHKYHEALEKVISESWRHKERLKDKCATSTVQYEVAECCINAYDIKNQIINFSKKHSEVKVTIVDCLQSIKTNSLKSFIVILKEIAREYNVHVILLSEVNSTADKREYGQPVVGDIIEKEVIKIADIIQLYYLRYYEADGFSLLRARTIK